MSRNEIIDWLLRGDVSIRYQVYRDLLSKKRGDLRKRIEHEGWGAKFLSKRRPEGHWGQKFYQPKWTSTHYTLLDLRNLEISPRQPLIKESIELIIKTEKGPDGGIRPIGRDRRCDVCLNGMFLNYASYFRTSEKELNSVVDFILSQVMPDGGFNCQLTRTGAKHSSLHSTLSVLEGITEYELSGYTYRQEDLEKTLRSSKEFILLHKLFLSDRTGEVINPNFLRLSFPGRWKYDILRALDYFRHSGTDWDERMRPAFEVLLKKRRNDKRWPLQARHPGKIHFEMEKAGRPSRWNTLRALRVLKYFGVSND